MRLDTPHPSYKGMPLYLQIREKYYQAILTGEYQPGDKLPSEDDIAQSFGVTRVTVNKALSELLAQGYLYRRHGAGTFVSKLRREGDTTSVLGFYESVQKKGFGVVSQVLESRLATPDKAVAEHLQMSLLADVFYLRRLRRVNGKPVVLQTTYIQGDFLPALQKADFTSQSLYEVMARAGHEVVRARDYVDAVNASDEVSALLEVPPRQALLTTRRTGFGRAGAPLELTYSIYRGDQYELEIEYPLPTQRKDEA